MPFGNQSQWTVPEDIIVSISERINVRSHISNLIKREFNMSSLISNLSPTGMNNIQRSGFFIAVGSIFLALILHYPFDGYVTKYEDISYLMPTVCVSKLKGIDMRDLTIQQITDDNKQMGECYDREYNRYLPFDSWKSRSPIVTWLGFVKNLIIVLMSQLILGAMWLWIFKDKETIKAG
jgi:hypothetical protein